MRKTFITIITAFTAICGYAQTAYDALLFSENEYEGTARTVAMGNAFTALGGDLGSIGLNPAGSAVAGYSQVTFTPALSFSASTTMGVNPYENGDLPYFERQMKSRMTSFNLPNMGIVLNFDTHRTSGFKNFTFGFIYNQTANWNEDTYAAGTNNTTSFMGSMAYHASNYFYDKELDQYYGISSSVLGGENAYHDYPEYWKYITGYQSGMLSTFLEDRDDQYVGASEVIFGDDEIALGGPIDQAYGRRVKGGKYDYIINIGANWSDFLYIGANLGITSIDYAYSEYFKEVAADPANFEIGLSNGETIYFNDMLYKYSYSATGIGYYGKIGVILTPGGGFRIGAAVQPPTINSISEEWQEGGETTYSDSYYNASSTSPYGQYSYSMVSPLRANFGLAYTMGKFGVVSADYEICDYSQMRFRTSGYNRDSFEDINADIRETFQASHMLRLGAEIKPTAELAIRAGYGLATTPERFAYESKGAPIIKRQDISFGLGYSSAKSFFADFAVRKSLIGNEYFMPYADYMFDNDGYIIDNGYAPEILIEKSLWKVSLTLGWRF